ncbi:hypothetical protein ACFVSN_37060 [Kitasatospora sp. NPDC057904]|uniref:hypothetical protein n=1 Tax=unclassified Kitasatospora TaxID=2633591 RepID=UPI0036DF8561
MRWIRRAARVTDGDLFQAWLYGGLTLAVDLRLLAIVRDARTGASLVFLASAGALAGFGLGVLLGRRRGYRRWTAATVPRPALRLVRCATTGALYAHLVLPAVLVVDVVRHPDHVILYLMVLGA